MKIDVLNSAEFKRLLEALVNASLMRMRTSVFIKTSKLRSPITPKSSTSPRPSGPSQ
jgi:hypothetical protein